MSHALSCLSSDNPYDAADNWLLKENLPLSYREQVVAFILQNTGQKDFTLDPSFRDPYTGCKYSVLSCDHLILIWWWFMCYIVSLFPPLFQLVLMYLDNLQTSLVCILLNFFLFNWIRDAFFLNFYIYWTINYVNTWFLFILFYFSSGYSFCKTYLQTCS